MSDVDDSRVSSDYDVGGNIQRVQTLGHMHTTV